MRLPASPPRLDRAQLNDPAVLNALGGALYRPDLPDGRYLHWDKFRRVPSQGDLSTTQRWFLQKVARSSSRVVVPGFVATNGQPFWFCGRLDALGRITHDLDRRDVARELLSVLGDDAAQSAYRVEQLIEEAISSSLIEGATITTRAQAKSMVERKRTPTSKSERMIWNNYHAMERLLALRDEPLTLDALLEIHALLGADALEVTNAEGRLRTEHDHVVVEDAMTHEVWHVPPPASELRQRLDALLAFANDDGKEEGVFIHPLLRAMILHFWLAYLHPFVDGNGRMARALFYWSLLRANYEFAQYLSISGPIDRAKKAYYLAFAYTETDDFDLTYFLLHQCGVLREATNELLSHLRTRTETLHTMRTRVRSVATLNPRQQTLLLELLEEQRLPVEIIAHQHRHKVTYLTARKDLITLEELGYLESVRAGRKNLYFASADLAERLRG